MVVMRVVRNIFNRRGINNVASASLGKHNAAVAFGASSAEPVSITIVLIVTQHPDKKSIGIGASALQVQESSPDECCGVA